MKSESKIELLSSIKMNKMFFGCLSLRKLNIFKIYFENINMKNFLYKCKGLEEVIFSCVIFRTFYQTSALCASYIILPKIL